jgi:hypothetical protein
MQREIEMWSNWNYPELCQPGRKRLAIPKACQLLQRAKIRKCNLLSNGSNYVFLVALKNSEMEVNAIYKPLQGEAPLWDFPSGTLYKREYAAFVVSQALEWHLIPPTVIRSGPYGIGSMQWFVDTADGTGYSSQTKDTVTMKQAALFDYLVNNADRKAGHFLVDKDGRLWVIDHGLTFNVMPKLRTVIWHFSGQSIPDEMLADIRALQSKLKPEKPLRSVLRRLLEQSEVEALEFRIKTILEKPVFVSPGPYRNIPWPWY